MKLKQRVFLRFIRKYLPKLEYSRVLRELSNLGGDSVDVVMKEPLPKFGETTDGGSVEYINFILDKKLRTYVPVVYVRDQGKLRPIPWINSRWGF